MVLTSGLIYCIVSKIENLAVVDPPGLLLVVSLMPLYTALWQKGDVAQLPKDQWIQVTGKIDKNIYNGMTVPIIHIQNSSKIPVPKNPYVYDVGVKIE